MHRIVIAPDSFKGSLTALEVAESVSTGIRRVLPDALVERFAMADGGEGTIEAVLASRRGTRHTQSVANAVGIAAPSLFATLEDGSRAAALIEVAQVVPLPAAPGAVEQRSSYGVGQQIRLALDLGAAIVLVALGGSSTNDAGAGILAALGVRFESRGGVRIERPTLEDLEHIVFADFSRLDPRLRETEMLALSDIDNPLCGAQGATAVYGPQKGVELKNVGRYDGWIGRFARLCEAAAGRDAMRKTGTGAAGGGAAGGIGWALQLIGATAKSGALAVAGIIGLEAALDGAAWALTGEGQSDLQTLRGKVPLAVSQLARRRGVPVTLLSGGIAADSIGGLTPHFDGCFSIMPRPMALESAITNAASLVADAAEQLTRLTIAKVHPA